MRLAALTTSLGRMRSLLVLLAACSTSSSPPRPTEYIVYDTLREGEFAAGDLYKPKRVRLLNDCSVHGAAGKVVFTCPAADMVLELDCAGRHQMVITGVTYDIYCQ